MFAVPIPFYLKNGTAVLVPLLISPPVNFTTLDTAVAVLRAALSASHTVKIDAQGSGEENWERMENLPTQVSSLL